MLFEILPCGAVNLIVKFSTGFGTSVFDDPRKSTLSLFLNLRLLSKDNTLNEVLRSKIDTAATIYRSISRCRYVGPYVHVKALKEAFRFMRKLEKHRRRDALDELDAENYCFELPRFGCRSFSEDFCYVSENQTYLHSIVRPCSR